MKKTKKSLTGYLIFIFCIAMMACSAIAFITFSHITKNAFKEIKNDITIDENNVVTIEHKIENNVGIVGSRVIYTVISGLFVSAAIILMASQKIIKPIKKLSMATKEISKGNYDIELTGTDNNEIGELTQNFNKMANVLKNVEYLQKDFMSNVSHEFKTPVASIQGFAKLLKDENISKEEKEEYLNIIIEESNRLSNLSTNVLKLSKIENKDFKLNLEPFSLDEQIRKSILILEPRWSKKNIEFELDLETTSLIADKDLLQQVWINLIGNAIKFSDKKGEIIISLKEKDNNVAEIKIKDNGIGISRKNQERIFDRFYQVNKSHSQEGNGLGLTISKKIIELHKGTINVESKEYEGTEFKINLPNLKEKIKNS